MIFAVSVIHSDINTAALTLYFSSLLVSTFLVWMFMSIPQYYLLVEYFSSIKSSKAIILLKFLYFHYFLAAFNLSPSTFLY